MANGHGGPRKGAGRKRHSYGPKRKEAMHIAAETRPIDSEIEEGISPLEIMMARMQELWQRGDDESRDRACGAG